jgi:NAD(P)-dependent dehydrogenase (short-subunit alcohol dehydrogenase family)
MALFNGRVIAVTGAASGIGLATTHLLASRGASLSLAGQNEARLGEVERDIRGKYPSVEVLTYMVDVRKEEGVKRWIEVTMEKFGRLDGAANMAGVIGMLRMISYDMRMRRCRKGRRREI